MCTDYWLEFPSIQMYMELWLEDGKRSYQQLASSRSIVHMYIHFPPFLPPSLWILPETGGIRSVQLRDNCKGHWAPSRGAHDCCKGKSYLVFIIGYTLWIHTRSIRIEKLVADIIFFCLTVKISFKRKNQFYSFSFFLTLPWFSIICILQHSLCLCQRLGGGVVVGSVT